MPDVKDRELDELVEFEMEDDEQYDPEDHYKAPDKDVHHMVRGISKSNRYVEAHGSAYFPVAEIDANLTHWLDQGYTLRNVFYLGEAPEGYHMMYILIR